MLRWYIPVEWHHILPRPDDLVLFTAPINGSGQKASFISSLFVEEAAWHLFGDHSGVSKPGQHHLNDALEGLHLLLDGTSHTGVGEAHRVGDVRWQIGSPRDKLGQASGELHCRLMGEEGGGERLLGVEALREISTCLQRTEGSQ